MPTLITDAQKAALEQQNPGFTFDQYGTKFAKDPSGFFIQGNRGNIQNIPEGSLVSFSDISGLEGYPNLFKKQGNQFIPQTQGATGPVIQVQGSARGVMQFGLGIAPLGERVGPLASTSQPQQFQMAGLSSSGASIDPTTKVLTLPNGQRISPQDTQTYNALIKQHGLEQQAGVAQPLAPGEFDALVKRYTDAGYSAEEATKRVQELTANRPVASLGAPATGNVDWNDPRAPAGWGVDRTTGQFVQPGGGTNVAAPGGIVAPPASSAFKTSPSYKALSKDLQDLVDLAFSTFTGTPEQQQVFANALKNAQTLADPYAKTQLALAFGEFQSKIAFEQGDLERASGVLESTRQQIQQEVAASKDFLSLQQQSEIAKAIRGYNEDLLNIADQAAEKGLTFATGARSRALAEERRGEQLQDVIQSTQREANFRMNELSARAAQGDTKAAQQLADLKAKSSFNLETIGRAAERVLGTSGLPTTPSYAPTGGVLGDIEQERRKSIIDIASLGLPQ